MKIFLTLIIAITQAIIYFIPQDKAIDNRSKFLKKITAHGWKIIFCSSITVIATIILLITSEKESIAFNIEMKKRDSLTDSNRKLDAEKYIQKLKENNDETRNALLEYGYEMDSTSMEIKKSLEKAKDTVLNTPDPFISIRGIKVKSKTIRELNFLLPIHSDDATTYDPELKLDIVARDYQDRLHLLIKNFVLMESYLVIPKDNDKNANFVLWNKRVEAEEYYFYIRGIYRKSHKGKKIHIDDIYGYRVKDSATIELRKSKSDEVKKFANSTK